MLEAKRRELLSYAPLQSRDMDLPDPAREPDSFASIMLGPPSCFCISILQAVESWAGPGYELCPCCALASAVLWLRH